MELLIYFWYIYHFSRFTCFRLVLIYAVICAKSHEMQSGLDKHKSHKDEEKKGKKGDNDMISEETFQ